MILDSITEIAVLGTAKKQLTQEQKDWCATFKIGVDRIEQSILQAVYLDSEMNIVGATLETEDIGEAIEKINPIENEIEDSYTMYIETMLQEFPQLVHNYISMVFDQNKVLPKRFIPKYLDYIKTWDPSLRYEASLIGGERAIYLAQFSNKWNFLLPSTIDWETAFHKQRVTYVRNLRASDPAAALEFVKKGYKENHSTERQEFLNTLVVNLSTDDCEFLRENLEDRSKVVRQSAYTLLAVVDKEIQQELSEYAALSIKIGKVEEASKVNLEIILPESSEWLDQLPKAERTGVQVGKKAEKLLNLISVLPLSFYTLAPSQMLSLVLKSEWSKVLIKGIQNATILHQNTAWAMALIPYLQSSDVKIDSLLLNMLSDKDFNTMIEFQLINNNQKFRYNEALGKLFKEAKQAIDFKNSKELIKQLAEYYIGNRFQGRNLYAEDLRIIKSILSHVDWSITTLPAELEDFEDLFITKQKLKDSLK